MWEESFKNLETEYFPDFFVVYIFGAYPVQMVGL